MVSSERSETERLQRRLQRERAKVGSLEKLIEDRSRALYAAKSEAESFAQSLDAIVRALPEALLVIDGGAISHCNQQAERLLSMPMSAILEQTPGALVELPDEGDLPWEAECLWQAQGTTPIPAWTAAARIDDDRWVLIARDLRERKQLEAQLLQAQKLESIGQLAAGVAHEINTPVQFVSDSVHFLQEAHADMQPILAAYREILPATTAAQREKIDDLEDEADIEFLDEEVPKALQRAIDGLERVAGIVRAMKEFAHPDSSEQAPADLNDAIRNTLVVARNEYKYCAEVSLDLGELPPVVCQLSELNQVFLNLIVNAAHAIADHTDSDGRILISSSVAEDMAEISIEDNGGGVPAGIRERVFDPFFTTKAVGRGTGQGLAIARNIVVDKHQGELLLSDGAAGARFIIRVPIAGAAA